MMLSRQAPRRSGLRLRRFGFRPRRFRLALRHSRGRGNLGGCGVPSHPFHPSSEARALLRPTRRGRFQTCPYHPNRQPHDRRSTLNDYAPSFPSFPILEHPSSEARAGSACFALLWIPACAGMTYGMRLFARRVGAVRELPLPPRPPTSRSPQHPKPPTPHPSHLFQSWAS